MSTVRARRGYLDALRGIAVLIMIEAHVIDSWTRAGDRQSHAFGYSLILGGFGAPLFLFLAGVAVALSAASKARRLGDERAASAAVVRRGLEIFLLAFVFRFQAFVISRSAPWLLLRVDILNIMGPAIMATALLWGACRTARARLTAFALATIVLVYLTPLVRGAAWVAGLPDPVEAYLRPVGLLTNFAIFPWAAFVPAGAILGVLVDGARTRPMERRLNLGFAIAGVVLAVGAYRASYFPELLARSAFWTTSASYFFMRVGIMTAAVAVAFAWELRPTAGQRWSPLQLLGRTSLFIYWIHVEMVYGVLSLPIHRAMTLGQAWLALCAFCGFMLVCAVVKDRTVAWWRAPRPPHGLGAQPVT
jgi:uncharacterized membrane protein